jgi:hypothetical protein
VCVAAGTVLTAETALRWNIRYELSEQRVRSLTCISTGRINYT